MALTIIPRSATVSSPVGIAQFSWRVSGGSASATGYGISDSPITTVNTDVYASGSSGTLRLGVGTHTFYGFYTMKSGSNTYYYSLGSASVSVVYEEPEPTTVTATKRVYLNGTYSSSVTQGGLYPGGTFTPSSHAPSAPSGYTIEKIMYGSQDVTTGSITCPSSDFTLDYYYISSAVDLWDWAASNGEASAAQTAAAYAAVTGGGSCAGFNYLVWNDMCDKVQEVIDALGSSWVTHDNNTGEDLPNLASTKMTSSDKTLTAKRYNALRLNVGSRYSTGIASVSAGDSVSGQTHFVTLMRKVNEWIASI